MTTGAMPISEALETILADEKAHKTSLNYAINYTRQARIMLNHGEYEAFRTQLLYVLSNITHWRHPKAKEVRQAIRAYLRGSKV